MSATAEQGGGKSSVANREEDVFGKRNAASGVSTMPNEKGELTAAEKHAQARAHALSGTLSKSQVAKQRKSARLTATAPTHCAALTPAAAPNAAATKTAEKAPPATAVGDATGKNTSSPNLPPTQKAPPSLTTTTMLSPTSTPNKPNSPSKGESAAAITTRQLVQEAPASRYNGDLSERRLGKRLAARVRQQQCRARKRDKSWRWAKREMKAPDVDQSAPEPTPSASTPNNRDSPFEDVLSERRLRKRIAARVGMQRCRARKKEEAKSPHEVEASAPPEVTQWLKKAITVSVQDQAGVETFFKIKRETRVQSIFDAYAQSIGFAVQSLTFFYKGTEIDGQKTPLMLGLIDQDQIDVTKDAFTPSEAAPKLPPPTIKTHPMPPPFQDPELKLVERNRLLTCSMHTGHALHILQGIPFVDKECEMEAAELLLQQLNQEKEEIKECANKELMKAMVDHAVQLGLIQLLQGAPLSESFQQIVQEWSVDGSAENQSKVQAILFETFPTHERTNPWCLARQEEYLKMHKLCLSKTNVADNVAKNCSRHGYVYDIFLYQMQYLKSNIRRARQPKGGWTEDPRASNKMRNLQPNEVTIHPWGCSI